jgi:uncharacterized protein YxjI
MRPKLHPAFAQQTYLFRRQVFKLFGAAFHAYDPQGNLIFYSKQKAFKLREDIRIYSDETMSQELLTINTPQILDLGATYNIQDATTGEFVGSVRRKFLKSIVCDEWHVFSADGRQVGTLVEKYLIAAIISRLIELVPQTYTISDQAGMQAAQVQQHFNPFILKYTMTVSPQPNIDRRLLVACGILLAAIERRQDN